ncbi:cbb3-type cytochrome c oxidase N-terminal domain-containing protein [Mucilaginibacter sp. AK015]|uniref:cbb3-type cytochrome c oxidase N-terminal domain-containing protein n=1 Tax=Mucilaginibacter sp. AK015 TaxID=2723072 RepID=UPI00161B3690|nr:cbb3-type cytochrome c oxidase N-terminal domain-containing protein [Mucilaginibacter sp. AK015]MBB5396893.1 cytochrome c oxidase cbb3-type subunit 3 [Mucilaginibacter sp. AK015]
MKKLLVIPAILSFAQTAGAQNDSLLSDEVKNYIGFGAIIAMLLLFVGVFLILLRTFKVITKVVLRLQGYSNAEIKELEQPAKKEKPAPSSGDNKKLLKLLSLKPMSEEKSLLIAHEYDGIQELNNPTPAWFMWLFYVTIVFAFCYMLIYHVFGVGQLQYDEYKNEVAQAEVAKKIYLSKAANRVDENTVKLVHDPAVLASGKAIFKQTCAPCHGDDAQGNVGPNLTDDYWLHGGKINDIFKTIKYGVSAKGMPSWEKQLSPKQIADVANYIKSLKGSNPANPKAPQGEKEADEAGKLALN